MSFFVEYIFKLSISLSIVGLFYYFVLRKHTFYDWNRWYLLGYSALAFVIPFVDVNTAIQRNELTGNVLIQSVPALPTFANSVAMPTQNTQSTASWEIENWILILITLGAMVMMIRLCLQFLSYLKIRKAARLVSDEDVKIYHLSKDIVPFSFGNSIFINPDLHNQHEMHEIILHEFVHVKQRHSFDIIFAELLCILNWYNPFVWLIRFSIRQNLEYIADRQVLKNGINVKEYQYLLLKVVGVPEFRIANQFNFSSLKQRIVMMNKVKTPRVYLIRFLFILPLLLVLVLACRNEIEDLANDSGAIKIDQSTAPRFAGYIIDGASGKAIEDFPLTLKVNEVEEAIVRTDKNGFYYWTDQKWQESDSLTHYTLSNEDGKYRGFIMGLYNRDVHGQSQIIFVSKKWDQGVRTEMYLVDQEPFFKSGDNSKAALARFLDNKKIEFAKEYNLTKAFRNAYSKAVHVITKFENGYFDQDRELVGLENDIQFYLDGKKVNYEDVNQAFKFQKVAALQTTRVANSRFLNKEMFYLTFPTNKTAPPAYLLKNNLEWIEADKFDLALLEKDAYFLDGFRQVFGVGSNLKPIKKEIKRVVLFKGDLAKYYDNKLDKVWWIETRPESEVYGRPALLKR